MKNLTIWTLGLGMAVNVFAGIEGLPKNFTCKNTSDGEFLYSIEVSTVDGLSKAVVTNEKAVTSLAGKLKVMTEAGTIFQRLELISEGPECESNETNPFSMRCHPKLDLAFIKKDTQEAVHVPVGFSSVWSTHHIHETAFTTWDEVEIRLGATGVGSGLGGSGYLSEVFIIDHPQCVLKGE